MKAFVKKILFRLSKGKIVASIFAVFLDVFNLRKEEKKIFLEEVKVSYPICERNCDDKTKHKLYRRYLRLWLSYGFDMKDFFIYRLYRHTDEECAMYISNRHWLTLDVTANRREYWDIFEDKAIFYEYFKTFMKRAVLPVNGMNDKERFIQMCSKHKRVIVKPRRAHRGEGIRILSTASLEEVESAWEIVLSEKLVVEEIVKQDAYMAELHEGSLNTVRVSTAQDHNGNIHIMACSTRMGTGQAFVDNVSNGIGLFAGVDKDSGILLSPGFDIHSKEYLYHPDTGVAIPGRIVPHWEKLRKLSVEAAKTVPQMRFLGWDWALNSLGEWELIEGNNPGAMITLQTSLNRGLKREYDTVLL